MLLFFLLKMRGKNMYTRAFIDEVKSATDICQLISDYTKLEICGDDIYQGRCPHPDHNDGTPSFRVWKKEQSWACMGCHFGKKNAQYKNYGSDCFSFIQWITNHKSSKKRMTWSDAVAYLAKKAGIEIEVSKYDHIYKNKYLIALSYHNNIPDNVRNYLNGRNITNAIIDRFIIGFDGKRITFPLFDRYGNVLGFSRRKIFCNNDKVPKYINCKTSDVFAKRKYLYGVHLLTNDCDELRITEGATDVVLPNSFGLKNVVATLGTAFTDEHVSLVKQLKKTPVFCMDGDEAGLLSLEKSIDMLAIEGIYSKVLILPHGKDLAELSIDMKGNIEEYVSTHSMSYWQYKLNDIVNQYDSKINELHLKFLPSIKRIIESVTNHDEKIIALSHIKNKLNLTL